MKLTRIVEIDGYLYTQKFRGRILYFLFPWLIRFLLRKEREHQDAYRNKLRAAYREELPPYDSKTNDN